MNNTTDMQSVSRTRHKSAQISAISQNATGQCAQAAARAPPRGERRAGLEAGPLGTNAKLRATFENPMARRVERFALSQLPETSSPIPELQNACVFAPRQGRAGVEVQEPQDSKLRRVADLRERLDVSCLWG